MALYEPQKRIEGAARKRNSMSKTADEPLPWVDWWHPSRDGMAAGRCQAMWVASLHARLVDSLTNRARVDAGVREDITAERAPSSWWESSEMRLVADLAGFDGGAVQQKMAALVATKGAAAVAQILAKSKDAGWTAGRE